MASLTQYRAEMREQNMAKRILRNSNYIERSVRLLNFLRKYIKILANFYLKNQTFLNIYNNLKSIVSTKNGFRWGRRGRPTPPSAHEHSRNRALDLHRPHGCSALTPKGTILRLKKELEHRRIFFLGGGLVAWSIEIYLFSINVI